MDQGSVPYWVATLLNYKHLKSTNPRSIDDMQVANLPESAMDLGLVLYLIRCIIRMSF